MTVQANRHEYGGNIGYIKSSHFAKMHEFDNSAREPVAKLLLFPIIVLVAALFSHICLSALGGILLL